MPDRLKSISFCQSAKLSSSTGALGFRNDRAAADRVDEDVDRAELLQHRGDRRVDIGFVERVAQAAMRPPAGLAQRRDGPVEPLLVVIDGDDDRALARHDVGGGAADAARRRGDQRDLVLKAHPFPLSRDSRPGVPPLTLSGEG